MAILDELNDALKEAMKTKEKEQKKVRKLRKMVFYMDEEQLT